MTKKTHNTPLSAKELEEKFDNGGNTDADFDWAAAQRPGRGKRTRINPDVLDAGRISAEAMRGRISSSGDHNVADGWVHDSKGRLILKKRLISKNQQESLVKPPKSQGS